MIPADPVTSRRPFSGLHRAGAAAALLCLTISARAEESAADSPGESAAGESVRPAHVRSLDEPPVLVWNNRPAPDDSCRWYGRTDAGGHADGAGTLVWFKNAGGVPTETLRYSGTMREGRFEGMTLGVKADGMTMTGRWSHGVKHGPWTYHSGAVFTVRNYLCGKLDPGQPKTGASSHEAVRSSLTEVETANGAGHVFAPAPATGETLTWRGAVEGGRGHGYGILCRYRGDNQVEAIAGCMARGRFHGLTVSYSSWLDTGAWTGRGETRIGSYLYGLRQGEWINVTGDAGQISRFDGGTEVPGSQRPATGVEAGALKSSGYILREDIRKLLAVP